MTPTSPNRRAALLAAAGTLAAIPVAASAAPIVSQEADPIFGIIERHRKAMRVIDETNLQGDGIEEKYSRVHEDWWRHVYSDIKKPVPKRAGEPADWWAAQLAQRDASIEWTAAAIALFSTKPRTLAGVIALLQYADEREYPAHGDTRPARIDGGPHAIFTVFGGGLESAEPVAEAARGFLSTIAQALQDIAEKESS